VRGRLQSFLLKPICSPALAQYKAADSFTITTLLGPAMPVLHLGQMGACGTVVLAKPPPTFCAGSRFTLDQKVNSLFGKEVI